MQEMFFTFSKRCNVYDKNMRTPLYLAAMNNQKRCVEILLNKGGNPFLYDLQSKYFAILLSILTSPMFVFLSNILYKF